ncbi:microfibril-associated glycoprotein 4-like [Mugil cephalus]|uniref:microfibril-associated glycoprotein 4-like n=1 Tax=Mugil cephalus TaxID=48193 RepID=UPI001FB5B170|nr:microfibril-associated glycoprotein 4-like [Mugil cephalus]
MAGFHVQDMRRSNKCGLAATCRPHSPPPLELHKVVSYSRYLFSLCTDDCASGHASIQLAKSADETMVLGLIEDVDDKVSSYILSLFQLISLVLLLTPMLTSCTELIHHQDNSSQTGVYTIYPLQERSVYCDMDSEGGHWMVFQRRMDGSLNFYRPWDQYKLGFGNATGEYWLGLDNIHYLTTKQKYELLVTMEDFDGKKVFARYTSFKVDAECDGYRIHVSGFIDGGAGDALTYHDGQKFSTFDKDQDSWPGNCARSFLGAFWYNTCFNANPNGIYRWGADKTLFAVGVEWSQWKGYDYSLKSISMMIRPVQ